MSNHCIHFSTKLVNTCNYLNVITFCKHALHGSLIGTIKIYSVHCKYKNAITRTMYVNFYMCLFCMKQRQGNLPFILKVSFFNQIILVHVKWIIIMSESQYKTIQWKIFLICQNHLIPNTCNSFQCTKWTLLTVITILKL